MILMENQRLLFLTLMEGSKISKILIFIFSSLILINCKKTENIKKIKPEKQNEIFQLVEKGGYSFRRNYSYSEDIYNNEKEKKQLDNRNPEITGKDIKGTKYYSGIDSMKLFDNLSNLNIEQWDELKNIKYKGEKFNYNEKKYIFSISDINSSSFLIKLRDLKNNIVLTKKLDYDLPPDVIFQIRNIDNDKNDEIISFYHSYIANGDNYDINIYELEEK